MILSVIKEKNLYETRVAITPDAVKLFQRLGLEVFIEQGAGIKSGYLDEQYKNMGAKISSRPECLKADECLCVRMPSTEDIKNLKRDFIIIWTCC